MLIISNYNCIYKPEKQKKNPKKKEAKSNKILQNTKKRKEKKNTVYTLKYIQKETTLLTS